MNNFHIYEEIGKGRYSVVYKVLLIVYFLIVKREERKKLLSMLRLKVWKSLEEEKF
jgi:hypothetical protein